VPRSIALIIDYSGSQFPYIENSVEAAKVLIDKLGPRDRLAIITDDIEMLCDFTTNKTELKKKLDILLERSRGKKSLLGLGGKNRRLGLSAQYSALMATLKEAFDAEDQRPIIVFKLTAMRRSIFETRSSSHMFLKVYHPNGFQRLKRMLKLN
jgi:hypothetical protein